CPAGGFIGLQSGVAVIVADAYPADLTGAVLRAAMVLGGGLVQTLFVVSIWPLRRFASERGAVAQLYRELAGYARELATAKEATPPAPGVAPNVAAMHADPHPLARHGEALVFQALADEAERLRVGLAALSLSSARHNPGVTADMALLLDEL